MSIPMNEAFKVKLQGQTVDCIRVEALEREVTKNGFSIFYCTISEIVNLIRKKIEVNSASSTALWIASADGVISNGLAGSSTFKKYDLLFSSSTDNGTTIVTTRIGSVITDDGKVTTSDIYDDWNDVYANKNFQKGSIITFYDETTGRYSIYTRVTEYDNAVTDASDWECIGSANDITVDYDNVNNHPVAKVINRSGSETDSAILARELALDSDLGVEGSIISIHTYDSGNLIDTKSYIRSGDEFKLIGGKNSADSTVLLSDITLSGEWSSIGGVKKSSQTLQCKGWTVEQLLDFIFNETVAPTIKSLPSLSFSITGAGEYEIGSTVTLGYSISFTDGKYKSSSERADQLMRASFNSYSIHYISDGTSTSLVNDPAVTKSPASQGNEFITSQPVWYTFTIPEGYKKKIVLYPFIKASTTEKAKDNKGNIANASGVEYGILYNPQTVAIPNDGTGDTGNYTHFSNGDFNDNYPITYSIRVSSYRVGAFYGCLTEPMTAGTIMPASVRALTKEKKGTSEVNVYVNTANGTKQIVVAVLKGSPAPTMLNETVNSVIAGITKISITEGVSIPAADGSNNNAALYDVYAYTPSIPFRAVNRIKITMTPRGGT